MFGYSTVFGIDSHARTTTVCALVVETGEAETRTFPGNPHADIAAWMGRFPQPPLGSTSRAAPASCPPGC